MAVNGSFGINGLVGLLRELDKSRLDALVARFPDNASDLTKGFGMGQEAMPPAGSPEQLNATTLASERRRATFALALAKEVGIAANQKVMVLRKSAERQRLVKVILIIIAGITGASTLAAGAQLILSIPNDGQIAVSSTTWWIASLSTVLTAGTSVGNGIIEMLTSRYKVDLEKLIMQIEVSRFGIRVGCDNLEVTITLGDVKYIAESAAQLNRLAAELHGVLSGIL